MSNYVSPNQPNYGNGETSKIPPMKPSYSPKDDSFRKTFRERRNQKEEEELAVEEKSEKPSLFELSKNTRKTKTNQSSLQDQSSGLSLKKPLSSKEEEKLESYTFEGESDTDVELQRSIKGQQQPVKEQPMLKTKMNSAEAAPLAKEESPVSDNELSQASEFPIEEKEIPVENALENPELEATKQETIEMGRQQSAMMQSVGKSKKSIGTSETKESGPTAKKEKTKGEGRVSASGGQEKSNLAAVNPAIQSLDFQTESMQDIQDIPRATTIRDLANQIIERIQIMRRDDQTSTIVTLRYPPVLEGATLTLTTSDNAKREFNISFANLSPHAKEFLDQKLTEQSLTQALERKGIIVHMVSTSTQTEAILTSETGQTPGESKNQQQQGQGRQQPEEEEEGVT